MQRGYTAGTACLGLMHEACTAPQVAVQHGVARLAAMHAAVPSNMLTCSIPAACIDLQPYKADLMSAAVHGRMQPHGMPASVHVRVAGHVW